MKIADFNGQKLTLLDQRRLPHSEEYVECKNPTEVANAIREMVIRGAPAIGVAAAYGMALSKDPKNDAEILKQARPTAVDLFNAINYMLKEIEKGKDAEKAAKEWHEKIKEMTKKISENGASLIKKGDNVLLHCNAGPLATAAYGTSLGAVIEAHKQGKRIFVYVGETRPRFQGALTSWELEKEGIPHKVIVDSSAGYLMKIGKINCVMVGSDRVVKNGDFANKIGTYPLAVLAKENGIPFYVLFPMSTFDRFLETGENIKIEERDEKEVSEILGKRVYGKNTKILNLAFDVTPNRYVMSYITEYGIHKEMVDLWKNITE